MRVPIGYMPGGLNTELTDGFSCPLPQLRGVRLFTRQGEMTMASRIRNSRRQVLRKSSNNAAIFNGRADFVMVDNILIFFQESKDGSVSEFRVNLADSTFKRLSTSINKMLTGKINELAELCQKLQRENKVVKRKKRLTLAQRLAAMDETRKRKLALAS